MLNRPRSCRLFVALLLAVSASFAQAQSHPDLLAQALASADLSGSVIVTKAGVTVYEAGFGEADTDLGIANNPKTIFRIGSITKQFTAMGIMILQDRGVLSIQDPVIQHVEDAPETWRSLTLHQLLSHTSGIMHSWALPGFAQTMAQPTTLDETLERFYEEPLVFEPGTGFGYSGVGYFLLAKIIETASGMTYADFIRSEIFEPLGMRDSGADHPNLELPLRALGYVQAADGSSQNAPGIFMPILTGGGNLYSTVHDMARWNQALTERALVSEEAYQAMFTPVRNGFGYGWIAGKLDGYQMLSHSGGVPGFRAFNLRIPTAKLSVVVLTNGGSGRAARTARTLASIMLRNTN